jgi:hypothetical protein
LLDLSQFESVDDALTKIEPGYRYRDVGLSVLPVGTVPAAGISYERLFFLSMITRSEGLHGAIAREIRQSNPHAVFPLIRAFAEDVVLVIYAIDHPDYVRAVSVRPRERPEQSPRRKSRKALFDYAAREAPQIYEVYRELSEIGHFGSVAMWASHSVMPTDDDGILRAVWTSTPSWRSEKQALIACAQTLELADAMATYLRRFGERHVRPQLD